MYKLKKLTPEEQMREDLAIEIYRTIEDDLKSVITFLAGDEDKKKIINFIKKYLLK